jgi:cytosine/adenosine deaminase-related metal-dependent hydrolase
VVPVRWGHSVRTGIEDGPGAPVDGPVAVHLAEGITSEAADEVRTLERLGYLTSDLLAVHAVGIDWDGISRLRAAGAAVVWCPTSNYFLLGRTAPAELLTSGTDLLIGSDSLLSAEGDLLDELRAAHATGIVAADRLRAAVTEVAARRLGLPVPSLEPGAPADIVLLGCDLLAASARDVLMVMVAGVIRVLHPDLVPSLGDSGDEGRMMEMRGTARWTDQRATVPRMSRQAR